MRGERGPRQDRHKGSTTRLVSQRPSFHQGFDDMLDAASSISGNGNGP